MIRAWSAARSGTGDGEREGGNGTRVGDPGAPVAAEADMDADSVDGDGERPAVTACSDSLPVLRFDEKSRENIEEQ